MPIAASRDRVRSSTDVITHPEKFLIYTFGINLVDTFLPEKIVILNVCFYTIK